LSDPLRERLAAERDERLRLAELLHDGPVQYLAAIGQMLDASMQALAGGDAAGAAEITARALAVSREASADLRELVAGIEPAALHEAGFAAAVRELTDRVAARHGVAVELALPDADRLGEGARAGLYQIVRESVDQAVRRGPPQRIAVELKETPTGGVQLTITDDGTGERRLAVLDGLADRAAELNGAFETGHEAGTGTTVRITLPPSAARR
jgi:signal transduction histidine kinase